MSLNVYVRVLIAVVVVGGIFLAAPVRVDHDQRFMIASTLCQSLGSASDATACYGYRDTSSEFPGEWHWAFTRLIESSASVRMLRYGGEYDPGKPVKIDLARNALVALTGGMAIYLIMRSAGMRKAKRH